MTLERAPATIDAAAVLARRCGLRVVREAASSFIVSAASGAGDAEPGTRFRFVRCDRDWFVDAFGPVVWRLKAPDRFDDVCVAVARQARTVADDLPPAVVERAELQVVTSDEHPARDLPSRSSSIELMARIRACITRQGVMTNDVTGALRRRPWWAFWRPDGAAGMATILEAARATRLPLLIWHPNWVGSDGPEGWTAEGRGCWSPDDWTIEELTPHLTSGGWRLDIYDATVAQRAGYVDAFWDNTSWTVTFAT